MKRNITLFFKRAGLWVAVMLLSLSVAGTFTLPAFAQSNAKNDVCAGVNLDNAGACSSNGSELQRVIRAVVQILSIIAGIAAVIMLIVGGLKYITANGDSSSISSAKTTIIYAIIGLIIVAMAQIIVRFVLGKATQP